MNLKRKLVNIGSCIILAILIGGCGAENNKPLYESISEPRFDITFDDSETKILNITEVDKCNYIVEYERIYTGEIADIKEQWQRKYRFNEKTGQWDVLKAEEQRSAYDITVKAKDGIWLKVSEPNEEKSNHIYKLKFEENEANLVVYDLASNERDYYGYNLGLKELIFDEEKGIYCYRFKQYHNVYIIIEHDDIYVKYYNEPYGATFEYSEHDKLEWKADKMQMDIEIEPNMGEVKQVIVPNVVGKVSEEAQRILLEADLKVKLKYEKHATMEPGSVIYQSITSGETIDAGTEIVITICTEKAGTIVPNVVGMTTSQARKLLEECSYNVTIRYEESADVEMDYVISQEYEAGTELPIGENITIIVSMGE